MAKVAAAFFAFLEVQPGAHEAFNAWHLYDHVPENIALPGIARGERWAHTPDCVAARLHADESLAKTSYLVQYLFEEPVERTLEKFMDLGARMDGIGRFDRHFKMTMGGPFRLVKGYASPRAVVSPGGSRRGTVVREPRIRGLSPRGEPAGARDTADVARPRPRRGDGVAGEAARALAGGGADARPAGDGREDAVLGAVQDGAGV
ncbi:MAG: hypothetical protein HY261_00395 [Chloroflexi bacterium]|nr:hypothetical protein [Chloroflexota bacterium]